MSRLVREHVLLGRSSDAALCVSMLVVTSMPLQEIGILPVLRHLIKRVKSSDEQLLPRVQHNVVPGQ